MGGFEPVTVRRIIVPGEGGRRYAIGALACNDREVLPLVAPWLPDLLPALGGTELDWRIEIACQAWQWYRRFWRTHPAGQIVDLVWIFPPAHEPPLRSRIDPERFVAGEFADDVPLWEIAPYLASRVFANEAAFPPEMREIS